MKHLYDKKERSSSTDPNIIQKPKRQAPLAIEEDSQKSNLDEKCSQCSENNIDTSPRHVKNYVQSILGTFSSDQSGIDNRSDMEKLMKQKAMIESGAPQTNVHFDRLREKFVAKQDDCSRLHETRSPSLIKSNQEEEEPFELKTLEVGNERQVQYLEINLTQML